MLAVLILGASVANLNLAVANVALPDIGDQLHASQSSLTLVAVGFSLGLAGSVLYLGALADRYGRKWMLVAGLTLSIPASVLAALAPNVTVLMIARVAGGVCAGMAFPTTLSLISNLFRGSRRTVAIALWSGIGGGAAALGPAVSGGVIEHFWWGSAFLLTIPLAVIAATLALWVVPRHAGESTEPVDHLGGVLSVILVASVVLGINEVAEPGKGGLVLLLAGIALLALIAFVLRERRASNPLFDLHIARRRVFWVAAISGIIVFGSLMGALFIGQQFLQDVLSYSAFKAGVSILPASVVMVGVSPLAARLLNKHGARLTLVAGFVSAAAGFAVMLTWRSGVSYLPVGVAYALVGLGVGLAGAPASRSIMASVPPRRAGMGSATNDLQRDLGGAIMQSLLGALLVLRYSGFFTHAFANATPSQQADLSAQAAATIKSSFGGAQQVANLYPTADRNLIINAAKQAFTDGSHVAVAAALVAAVIGLVLVLVAFPKRAEELALEASYAQQDG